MSPQSGQRGSQGAAGAWCMCREVMRGRCALGKNGSAATLAVPLDLWAAQQAELRQLRAEIAHQGCLLAAAREAEQLREAAARGDRGGSMSSEAPSESSTPPSRPAEADTPQEPQAGSTGVGSGAERLVSASGSTQGPEGTPAAPQLAPPRAAAETAADSCRRELWAAGEASIVAAPPALQSAPDGRALLLHSRAAAGGPVERAAPRPSGNTVPRFRDALGRAARAVAAAALPHRFAQGGPRAAPQGKPQRRDARVRGAALAGKGSMPHKVSEVVGDPPLGNTAGGDAAAGAGAAVLRAALLGEQLRAANAERWALPAVEAHQRAAGVAGAEWVARGELTLVLERGACGVLRLQDADGQWLSKSQFRRRYKHNRKWEKALRRARQTESAALAPRQRSKHAQEAFGITDICTCIANFARNTWARVCRGAAIGWIRMAIARRLHWRDMAQRLVVQQRSFDNTLAGQEHSLCMDAVAELEAFRQDLLRSPRRWPDLIRRVEACQCIFEEARIQCGDLYEMGKTNLMRLTYSAVRLRGMLSVDPSELPL